MVSMSFVSFTNIGNGEYELYEFYHHCQWRVRVLRVVIIIDNGEYEFCELLSTWGV